MKKDDDFGLKNIDLENRKLSKDKKPLKFFIIVIILAGIYFLYNKNSDNIYTEKISELENKNHIIDSLDSEILIKQNISLSDGISLGSFQIYLNPLLEINHLTQSQNTL